MNKNQSISRNVLTQDLRELEEVKLIKRKVYAEASSRMEYSLTPFGLSLKSILNNLEFWGKSYCDLEKFKTQIKACFLCPTHIQNPKLVQVISHEMIGRILLLARILLYFVHCISVSFKS